MSQYDLKFDLKESRFPWPIFHGPLIWELVWPEVWPQNKCRSKLPILMVQRFCLISWRDKYRSCINAIFSDYETIWSQVWPQNKRWSQWPIFHGLWILPYILSIWCINIIFVIMCWVVLQNFSNLIFHAGKQCGPRSDCSYRSSLIWVHTNSKNDF